MELVITFQQWLKSDKNELHVLLRVSTAWLAKYSKGETYLEVKAYTRIFHKISLQGE